MKRKVIEFNFFNMIEVALAMAIIAFGMTSILGLFPVGINASKASQAENYSSDAVERIFGSLKNDVEVNKDVYDTYMFNSSTAFPTNINRNNPIGSPSKTLDTHSVDFIDDYMKDIFATYQPAFGGIYKVPMGGTVKSCVYFIVQGPGNTKNIDFSAMVLVWRSPTSISVGAGNALSNASWTSWPPRPISDPTKYDYVHFAALNIEISWPLEKKYAEREKRYYYFVVSRPQQ